jgi:hypothetical protein
MNNYNWNYHEALYKKFDLLLEKLVKSLEKKGILFFEKIEKARLIDDFQNIYANLYLKFNSEKERLIMYVTFIKNVDSLFMQNIITVDFFKVNLISYVSKLLNSLNFLLFQHWFYNDCDIKSFELNNFLNHKLSKNFNFLKEIHKNDAEINDLDLILFMRNSLEHISNLSNDNYLKDNEKIYNSNLKYAPLNFAFEHYWWADCNKLLVFAIEIIFNKKNGITEKPKPLYSIPMEYVFDYLLPTIFGEICMYIDGQNDPHF